ncbi:Fic family protein [Acidovorax sp. NCPPB 3859]|nr:MULTISPECIES: Fic family protein [unclassified Acidovorax]MDA8453078.1 Fic family protein [Acidovorax sp. GBBC 3297]MDA8462484.1 Fic family protein [Acidovorax sp. GBBC 3333]MDA8467518.1 Fic family protein [Acidovorax sp. GBBC 3332]MDA8472554.1 Fic family protein [Acidovorax sp. GBBC 3299]WCM78497.1 Fic family protein [Acidovorax sp. GBBC 712]
MWSDNAPRRRTYVWQRPDWPQWRFNALALAAPLAEVHRAQGHLAGRMAGVGLAQRDQATLRALTQEVVTTSAIEGESLDLDAVRSSIARRLGVDIGALAPSDRHVDGVVDMVLDATQRFAEPLTAERLFGWHAALFPTGYSGRLRIRTGAWRDDAAGPMQVVSGPIGREKVHYEAPPATALDAETAAFLQWFNAPPAGDPIVHAGLAHLWLVTLHPFDDGNGRISRAVGDMALARAEGSAQRFYSLSAQIQRERKRYYEQLEATQRGTLDVTPWLAWFLGCLLRAVQGADGLVADVLAKAQFWQRWADVPMNARQTLVLNRVLDGMEGKLSNARWAAIAKCSSDTALRDITDLLGKGVLVRVEGGGRNVAYALVQ